MPGADTQASAEILQEFVTTINHHDVSALVALMTTDHVLVIRWEPGAGHRVA